MAGVVSAGQGWADATWKMPAVVAAGVKAADAIPETRRCFPCLAAEELAERGRVRHTDPPGDRCAGQLGVR
jgi:hypothetical protein